MLSQIKRVKYTVSKKNFVNFIKYFVPLFTYTTFPVIQVIYPYNLLSGLNRLIFIFFFIALNTISLMLIFFSPTQNKKDKLIRHVHILLIIILLIVYMINAYWLYESQEGLFVLITRWIRNIGKYLFLSLHFLSFPFSLSTKYSPTIKKTQQIAILINALILPVLYIIFGEYDGRFLYVGLQKDSLSLLQNTSDYNNYLAIGDPLLFNSLILLVAIPTFFSYVISLLTGIFLALIGSRVAFIACFVVTVFSTFFVFYQTFSNLFNSFLVQISFRKNIGRFSLISFSVLITSFFFLLVFIFGDINDLFPSSFSDRIENVISFQNIQSSRVWQTLFEVNFKYDNSLNQREYLFSCHFDSLYKETSLAFFKSLFFGKPWQETECGNYLHSFLSIFFENGLLIFCLISFLIIYRFNLILIFYFKNFRRKVFITPPQIIYFMVTITFFIIGLFARFNISFFLPILMFSDVHLISKRSTREFSTNYDLTRTR